MTADVKKMSSKKTQGTAKDASIASATGSFLGDVKVEFKKITWTSPEELKTYTKVVVGAVFAMGVGIYLTDLALQATLNTIEYLIKATLG